MARCTECGEVSEHDIDCSQRPTADAGGLYIYRVADVEALRADNTRLRAALEAAPKPPWNFRPTIGWQGDYCDWYEAQETLGKGDDDA